MNITSILVFAISALILASTAPALERPGVEFKIFQFLADQIPRIDAKTNDWAIVPGDHIIGTNQLSDTVKGHGTNFDRNDLDVKVKVGWVQGINQLYWARRAEPAGMTCRAPTSLPATVSRIRQTQQTRCS